MLLAGCGGSDQRPAPAAAPPPPAQAASPTAPAPIPAGRGHLLAQVQPGRRVVARTRPRGEVVGRIGARTEFGGPSVLWVRKVAAGGRWLAVSAPLWRSPRPVWIRSTARDVALGRTRHSLRVVLSQRRLEFLRDGRVVRRMTVAIGRAANSTPTGRFAVTDSLKGESFGGAYGCCVIALTARQPNLPPGWIGGDRVAIHGTRDGAPGAESTGCIRAAAADLRWLTRRVRLGMPVTIEA